MPCFRHSNSSERQGKGNVAYILTCRNDLSALLNPAQEGHHGMMLLVLLPSDQAGPV